LLACLSRLAVPSRRLDELHELFNRLHGCLVRFRQSVEGRLGILSLVFTSLRATSLLSWWYCLSARGTVRHLQGWWPGLGRIGGRFDESHKLINRLFGSFFCIRQHVQDWLGLRRGRGDGRADCGISLGLVSSGDFRDERHELLHRLRHGMVRRSLRMGRGWVGCVLSRSRILAVLLVWVRGWSARGGGDSGLLHHPVHLRLHGPRKVRERFVVGPRVAQGLRRRRRQQHLLLVSVGNPQRTRGRRQLARDVVDQVLGLLVRRALCGSVVGGLASHLLRDFFTMYMENPSVLIFVKHPLATTFGPTLRSPGT